MKRRAKLSLFSEQVKRLMRVELRAAQSLTLMFTLQEADAVHQPPLPGLSLRQYASDIQELPRAQVRMMTTP